jgi:allophanate hydrolase subunit 2
VARPAAASSARPAALHRWQLLCSPGPQWRDFDPSARATLESDLYVVSPDCDRMGVRLRGRAVAYSGPPVLSEGQPAGAIQIPAGGQPIVLLAGRQTIGGYPKVGVVGRRGLAEMGQALPGDLVTFEFASLQEVTLDSRRWWSKVVDPGWAVEPA